MNRSFKPHGKQLIENFATEILTESGVMIEILTQDGDRARGLATLASVRDPSVQAIELKLDSGMTVAAAEAAFRTALGLRVRIMGPGGASPAGQTQLRTLTAQTRASQPARNERNDQISITGQKKISTLQREFTEHHSHLGIMLFSSEEYAKSLNGLSIRPLKGDLTIASVRERKSTDDISIHGNMLVKTLEARFQEVYGLYAQVCIMNAEGRKGYTGGSLDELSLSELNRKQKEKGRIPFAY